MVEAAPMKEENHLPKMLTPREIVAELDRHIVSQVDAKLLQNYTGYHRG